MQSDLDVLMAHLTIYAEADDELPANVCELIDAAKTEIERLTAALADARGDVEREISAWLRGKEGAWRSVVRDASGVGAPHIPRFLADAIERGDHRTGGVTCES